MEDTKSEPKRKGYWVMLSPEHLMYDDATATAEKTQNSGILINRLDKEHPTSHAFVRLDMFDGNIQNAIRLGILAVVKSNNSKWPHKIEPRFTQFAHDGSAPHKRFEVVTTREVTDEHRVGKQSVRINSRGPERAMLLRTNVREVLTYIEVASLASCITMLSLEKDGCGASTTPRVEVVEALEGRLKQGRRQDGNIIVVDEQDVVATAT